VARLLAQAEVVRARVRRAQAEASPDVDFGGAVGIEGDEITAGLTLRVTLPSPRADRAAAVEEAQLPALDSDRAALLFRLRAEVTQAWWTWHADHRRAQRLRGDVARVADEGAALAAELIHRGEGTALDHVAVLQQVHELRLLQVDAAARARHAAILVLAAGGAL
jgi:hypothetical protein